jgi:hypothetical protein
LSIDGTLYAKRIDKKTLMIAAVISGARNADRCFTPPSTFLPAAHGGQPFRFL